jgi:membrane protein
LLDGLQFALMAGGMAALYHYVPNTQVVGPHTVRRAVCLRRTLLAKALSLYQNCATTGWSAGALPQYYLLIWIYNSVDLCLLER